jgi:anti-sigma regulatory factor (Ser/Thr protein kinase)
VTPGTAAAVSLAVTEAVTNVVVHAYADAELPGEVEVTALLVAGELWVIVNDHGGGMRIGTGGPGGLGLGLPIIVSLADGADLSTPAEGGVEVRMRFAIGAPPDA